MGSLIVIALVVAGAYFAWNRFAKKTPAAPVAQSNTTPRPLFNVSANVVSNTTSTKV